jgi:hypothetical protein
MNAAENTRTEAKLTGFFIPVSCAWASSGISCSPH